MTHPVAAGVQLLLDEGRSPNLVFQPIVDLKRGETVGYECLSRFPGPPVAGPDQWFAAARELGRLNELELRVLEKALAARASIPEDRFLSVNVAPEALLDPRMEELLGSRSMAGVVFELTEHSAVTDYAVLMRAIERVRSRGGMVAVDDAGAGYASLAHILELRPDFVKLDRALIAAVHLDDAKAALVEMFGAFTNRIDAWILAEGIEEYAELERLLQLGIPLAQGYLLGRPDPQMLSLKLDVAAFIRGVRLGDDHLPLKPLLEQVTTFDASAEEAAIIEHMTRASCELAVALDPNQLPIALMIVHGPEVALRRLPMCVFEHAAPLQILKRALTRPAPTRFDPLVCCDESGHYRGVLRLERLIESLVFPPTRKPSWNPERDEPRRK